MWLSQHLDAKPAESAKRPSNLCENALIDWKYSYISCNGEKIVTGDVILCILDVFGLVAQLIMCLAVAQKDPSSNLRSDKMYSFHDQDSFDFQLNISGISENSQR
jgi:hypothetical protein